MIDSCDRSARGFSRAMPIDTNSEATRMRADLARRYANLFESPAAAFLEIDFSDVGAMVGALRKAGVTDLKGHLLTHPDLVRQMMRVARAVAANEHAVELFSPGRKADLLGSPEKFWPEASTSVFAEGIVAAVTGERNFLRETVMRTAQGVEFDAEFAVHFDPANADNALVTVGIVDITERNRARAAFEHAQFMYRNMFHGMAVPFLRLDSSQLQQMFTRLRKVGVVAIDDHLATHPEFVRAAMDALMVVEANQAAVQLYRAKDADALRGPISRFWNPGRERLIRDCLAAGFRGAPGFQGETRQRAMDGSEFDALMFVIGTPQMRAKGIVLVGLIDITEQVAARVELECMRSDLAHATRVSVLGELTASIAHEINQPLAAITTSSEAGLRWLQRADVNVEELRALLTSVVADAHRAADVMERVRSMATRRAVKATAISIDEVVEDVAAFLRHEMQSRDVTLELDLARHLPDINADRIQIQQVLLNLAVNAMQAMDNVPADRRCLRISTKRDGAKHVCVRVEDSGPGIPADRIPHLFESFYSTREGGMGMGLRICKSIVEAHGGHIEGANSPDGSGAFFTFTLPTGNVAAA
jgi:signal transduction histidine kinase